MAGKLSRRFVVRALAASALTGVLTAFGVLGLVVGPRPTFLVETAGLAAIWCAMYVVVSTIHAALQRSRGPVDAAI